MKKSTKRRLRIIFWTCFVLAGLLVLLVPPRLTSPPPGITVKVQQPEKINPPAPDTAPPEKTTSLSGGEETGEAPSLPPSLLLPLPLSPPTPPTNADPIKNQHPKIALVIDDVGIDLKGSARAIQLPPSVTLSFLPYALRLRDQAKQARDGGHELLLHMPMEPLGHEDPGPGALVVDLPMRDLQQRFENALASFTGFDGVNNHMGSKFTTYTEGMNMVVDELQQRHLFFLDSRTSANSVGKAVAQQKGLPAISRDVFLDDVQTTDAVEAQLDQAEHIARRKGYAVAIGHPHAVTMQVLEEWIPQAKRRGIDLVPLNSLVGK